MAWHPLDQDLREEDRVTNEDLMLILAGEVLPRDLRGRKLAAIERAKREKWRRQLRRNLTGYFESLGTSYLLVLLRQSYGHGSRFWITGFGYVDFQQKFESERTAEQILRSVLARRPHVPTRKECQLRRHSGRQHRNGFRQ